MKCPHCLTDYHPITNNVGLPSDVDGNWYIEVSTCSKCKKNNYSLINHGYKKNVQMGRNEEVIFSDRLIYPKNMNRKPVPIEVPNEYSADYTEACLVLQDSPKASAALSRRCLQPF